LKTNKSFILLGLLALVGSAFLSGCSGGGDKGEMAPLSDEELLNRGKAGHEAAAGGSPAGGTPPGQPQTTGLPPGAPPPSMPKR